MKQVDDLETSEILKIAQECLNTAGDFVELGCYEGDTSILLAEILKFTNKKLWIYDSFEGLPEKTNEDASEAGRNFQKGVLAVSKRDVKLRFLRSGLPVPIIKKAWFNELTDADLPPKIAFAFLDGDLYQSIKDSLKLVENKMTSGGVIIVHDYNNPELPGVTRAVDEWINNESLIINKSLAIIKF